MVVYTDGIRFLDSNSNVVISPFAPLDASATLILSGTPAVSAAQYFRTLGISNVVTNVLATRQTSPNITVTQPFSLTFGETVLFDTTIVPTLYTGVALDPSAIVFRASAYFPFSAGVASIAASSLPAGLSLVHTPGDSNAYLTGTPTSFGKRHVCPYGNEFQCGNTNSQCPNHSDTGYDYNLRNSE
jgi:hypothetical protein